MRHAWRAVNAAHFREWYGQPARGVTDRASMAPAGLDRLGHSLVQGVETAAARPRAERRKG